MRYIDADVDGTDGIGTFIPLKEKFAESAQAVDTGDRFGVPGLYFWDFSGPTLPLLNTATTSEDFYDDRVVHPAEILADLSRPGTDPYEAARDLDNIPALLEAYVALGRAGGVDLSGLRGTDVERFIADLGVADANRPAAWADRDFSVPALKPIMDARIDTVADDIDQALAGPVPGNLAIEPVLAALRALRDNALVLAADDHYTIPANGPVTIGAGQGLLANDASQPGLTVRVDPLFVPTPDSGSVDVSSDGGFVFTPDPGFVGGMVTFTDRATATVGSDGPTLFLIRSDPATVTLEAACPSDFNGDGTIRPDDIEAFIEDLELDAPGTDLNSDGGHDMFDLLLFLQIFDTPCGK